MERTPSPGPMQAKELPFAGKTSDAAWRYEAQGYGAADPNMFSYAGKLRVIDPGIAHTIAREIDHYETLAKQEPRLSPRYRTLKGHATRIANHILYAHGVSIDIPNVTF